MHGHVEARLGFEPVERGADLLDGLVGAVEGGSENGDDADRFSSQSFTASSADR